MTVGQNLRNRPEALDVVEEDLVALVVVDIGKVRAELAKAPFVWDAAPTHVAVEGGLQCVRVEVRDHGVGVPEEAEDKLFHPFYTTKEDGMGIGLATCRSLMQAQGGDIGYQRPEEGDGACFWFVLPIAGAEGAPCTPDEA